MEKKIVSIRDIDRPLSEYPEGTVFAQDHDNVVIPLPTKEEIEAYLKRKESTTSQ